LTDRLKIRAWCLKNCATMLAVAALFATAVASPTTDRYAALDVDGKLAGKPPPPPPPMQSWVSFNSSFGSDMVLQQVIDCMHTPSLTAHAPRIASAQCPANGSVCVPARASESCIIHIIL
jgi:hypothetical protein